jgi:uncharacterized GH25 family protein
MQNFFRRHLIVSFIACVSLPTFAHEFWLDPVSFFKPKSCVRFKVGEHFFGENWSGDFNKVKLLEVVNHEDRSTTNPQQMLPKPGDSLQFNLPFTGTQALIFNSTNSFIELDAVKFNEYLIEDGLAEIAAWRKQNGLDTTKGKEYYQRSTKVLLQNGDKTTPVNFPTALPLDIVPLTNPYELKSKTDISFRVYFMQRPLAKGEIKTWHVYKGKLEAASITMTDGSFTLPVTPEGKWMVSVVKMVPNDADTKADWQSYWGSITWGYY